MYKSKETAVYGYAAKEQEGAERSGLVSLQKNMPFLLFSSWSQQVCNVCH